MGLELVLAGVSLEPVVALAVPFVALPHSAVSVAAAVVGTALMWKIETDLRDIVSYLIINALMRIRIP